MALVTWPRAQLLDGSNSFKFSLETSLESESLEILIDFLTFLVKKLWPKNSKLINYLISGLIKYFLVSKLQHVIQSIKSLGFNLVSKTTSSKYYHLAVWAQGQTKWAIKA